MPRTYALFSSTQSCAATLALPAVLPDAIAEPLMLDPTPWKSFGSSYTPDATSENVRVRIQRLVSAARVRHSVEQLRHEIREVALVCAGDAREAKLRAEQCIIALKRAWTTAADAAGIDRPFVSEIAARLVTACVEEYYRDE